jgi:hypothetical protein
MSKKTTSDAGHFHAVKFYETPESLCRIVAEFLSEGLIAQQPALIIATPEHRHGILAALRVRDIDVDGVQAGGDLLLLDASQTLGRIMREGMPDAKLFKTTATNALEALCRDRKDCTVRAYGELVDVLWKAGHHAAAIRLEMFWNTLAATHDFALLCGYAMGSFYKDSALSAIHHQHSHIVSSDGAVASAARS